MIELDELKQLLKSYTAICREIEYLKEEIKKVQTTYDDLKSVTLDGMPKSNGVKSHIESVVVKMISLTEKYTAKLDDALQKKALIENIIYSVEDKTEQNILHLRFIKNYKLEDIADEMHYSIRQTKYIYKNALNKIKDCTKLH